MSSGAQVPLKKRRVQGASGDEDNDLRAQFKIDEKLNEQDCEVISIADDDEGSSYSNSSSQFDEALALKLPEKDCSQESSLASTSPAWTTQPFAAAVKSALSVVDEKKRKVSMSPQSLAKLGDRNAGADSLNDKGAFQLKQCGVNKNKPPTNNKTAAVKDIETKATEKGDVPPKKQKTANPKKRTKKAKDSSLAKLEQQEMELWSPLSRNKAKILASFDEESDEDEFLKFNPFNKRKRPEEGLEHTDASACNGVTASKEAEYGDIAFCNTVTAASNAKSKQTSKERKKQEDAAPCLSTSEHPRKKAKKEEPTSRKEGKPKRPARKSQSTTSGPGSNGPSPTDNIPSPHVFTQGIDNGLSAVVKEGAHPSDQTTTTEFPRSELASKDRKSHGTASALKQQPEKHLGTTKTKGPVSKKEVIVGKDSASKASPKVDQPQPNAVMEPDAKTTKNKAKKTKKAAAKASKELSKDDQKVSEVKGNDKPVSSASRKATTKAKDSVLISATANSSTATHTDETNKTKTTSKKTAVKKDAAKSSAAKSMGKADSKPNIPNANASTSKVSSPQSRNASANAGKKANTTTQTTTKNIDVSTSRSVNPNRGPEKGERQDKPKTSGSGTSQKAKPKKKRFDQQIYDHMVAAMKPFSLKSLAQDLRTTEQQLFHTLLTLKDKRLVVEKDFTSGKGKSTTLVWANLEAKEASVCDFSPEKAAAAHQELQFLSMQEKGLHTELAAVTKLPSNAELFAKVAAEEALIAELQAKLAEMKGRIASAKEGPTLPPKPRMIGHFQAKPKSAAELARERCPRRLKIRINAMRNEWKSRRDKCSDAVDTLADAMEKKPKEIVKMLDLETDEMAHATMPTTYRVDV